MADPLSQLRDFATQSRLSEIRQQDGLIVFGDYGWPNDTKTLFSIWNSGREGGARDYYTLETLLFFLQNSELPHPQYTREAVTRNVHVVRLPDRKGLLSYLKGESQTCDSIDRSAPLEITLQRPVLVKKLQEQLQAAAAEAEAEKKRARLALDEENLEAEISEQMGTDQGEHGKESPDASRAMPTGPEGISADKLAEIIAKRKQRKKDATLVSGHQLPTIPGQTLPSATFQFSNENNQGSGVPTLGAPSEALSAPFFDSQKPATDVADEDAIEKFPASTADVDLQRDVYSRERRWRTRLTLLKAPNNFADSVFNTLQVIKSQEEGSHRAPPSQPIQQQNAPSNKPYGLSGYSRYDQEKFSGRHEADDFNINTMGSYSSFLSGRGNNPSQKLATNSASRTSSVGSATSLTANSSDGSQRQKKTSRTPIIVIPASESALITMFNAQDLLQNMKFVATDERKNQGMRRDPEVLIHRQKDGGHSVPYRVIDSIGRLSAADWDRVVAVFVQGPAWQFKGWPWNGNPTEIFAHVKAFHLKFSEMQLDSNIKNWSVKVISLDRYKRHLDRASLQQFWDILDVFMSKQKPHLRF